MEWLEAWSCCTRDTALPTSSGSVPIGDSKGKSNQPPRKQRGRDEARPRKKECRVPQLKRSSKNLNANANASIITVNIVGVNYRVVVIDWLQTQDRLQTHFSFEGRSK